MPTKHNAAPVEDIDLAEAARQIAEKSAHERTTIEAQVREARHVLGSAQEQRTQLEQSRHNRAARIAELERTAADLDQKHQAALNFAKMAQNTLGEHKAVTAALAAQKLATEHQASLEKEQASAHDLNQQDTEQIAELDTIIFERQAILRAAPPRLQEIVQVEKQALYELGQAEYARFVEECAPYDARLDLAREELTAAQMERHAFLTQAAARFSSWTDLEEEVVRKLPAPDTATLRIMRAALAYLNQLIEDRMGLAQHLPESPTVSHFYRPGTWWNVLAVGVDVLYSYRNLQSREIPELQSRRDQLAQIIGEYEKAHARDRR